MTIALIISSIITLFFFFVILSQNKQLKETLNENIRHQNEFYSKFEHYLSEKLIAEEAEEIDKQEEIYSRFEHYPLENRTPEKEVKLKRNSFLYTDDDLGEMEEGVEK